MTFRAAALLTAVWLLAGLATTATPPGGREALQR
jgi:hypothetical protein